MVPGPASRLVPFSSRGSIPEGALGELPRICVTASLQCLNSRLAGNSDVHRQREKAICEGTCGKDIVRQNASLVCS
jgi:hypothetical protein